MPSGIHLGSRIANDIRFSNTSLTTSPYTTSGPIRSAYAVVPEIHENAIFGDCAATQGTMECRPVTDLMNRLGFENLLPLPF